MNKNLAAPIFCTLLALSLSACDTYKEESRMLGVGEIDVLTYDFAVADPTITSSQLDVVPGSTSKEVRVKPLRKGNAVVTVYDTAGQLRNKINYQFVSGVL
ncbi:MAG: hypothetical protein ACXVBE_14110, partial [Bdellovibrionota bacterium]